MEAFRLFACVLFSAMVGWAVHNADMATRENLDEHDRRPRYNNLMLNALPLPATIIVLLLAALLFVHQVDVLPFSLANIVGIFFQMTLYYIVLLLLLPLLRKKLSASACATLWMAPNFLYLAFYVFMEQTAPRWVIFIPPTVFRICLIVWLAGVAAILLWKITAHLLYRRELLKDAVPVTDPEILALWQSELKYANLKKAKYPIYRSPAAKTPLSIGLFKRSICVILPQRSYTIDELSLILRHELIHISRRDGSNKFFLLICTALCWFSPFSWLAMHRSADDMELSCDELALLDSNEQQRKKYASLLLETAGDGRGFSTCLSASAQALRYRMRCVLHPGKVSSGAFAMALAVFLLLSSFGSVAFAFESYSGQTVLFPEGQRSEYRVDNVRDTQGNYFTIQDEEALWDYLTSMTYTCVRGHYTFEETNTEPQIHYYSDSSRHSFSVSFTEKAVKVTPNTGNRHVAGPYISTQAPDMEKIHALLLPTDAPDPFPPELLLHFDERSTPSDTRASQWLSYVEPQEELPADEVWGGPEPICRIQAPEGSSVRLEFITSPRSYTVVICDGDGLRIEELDSSALTDNVLPLHPATATYTIYADFDKLPRAYYPEGSIAHMVYQFTVQAPPA